ncbi:MAG TPA: hypothetical protein VJ260_01060, partial [Vicinamibacterales bacterium]|nr:hypothetical protein [Vicinamibacterales bacterium]
MSRVITAAFVIGLALSHAAAAQVAPPPRTAGSAAGALTRTVLAIDDKKTLRNNPTGGETFTLDPVLTLSLDAPPATIRRPPPTAGGCVAAISCCQRTLPAS